EFQRGYRDLLTEGGQPALARHAPDPHRRGADQRGLRLLELAHDDGDQIRRHDDRVGEADDLARALARLRDDARVRYRREGGVDRERDAEDGFEGRLVPAGERAARVGGLELRGRHRARHATRVLVDRAIESAQLVVEGAAERQPEAAGPGRQRCGHRQPTALGRLVEGDGGALLVSLRVDHDRLVDDQLDGVEDDLADRFGDLDGDALLAAKGQRGEVGLEPDVVTARDDGARESVRVHEAPGGVRVPPYCPRDL